MALKPQLLMQSLMYLIHDLLKKMLCRIVRLESERTIYFSANRAISRDYPQVQRRVTLDRMWQQLANF